jgi:hypothetical protein
MGVIPSRLRKGTSYPFERAHAAVERRPDHPPNQLVLGEALLENDRAAQGLRALEQRR